MNSPITVWKRFDDVTRSFEHNHIEDGHVPAELHTPTGKFPDQHRNWQGGLWVRFHSYLNENNQVVDAK